MFFLLTGTKKDIRTLNDITRKRVQKLCKKEGLVDYVECSAMTQEGIQEVFDQAILAVVGKTNKSIFPCTII